MNPRRTEKPTRPVPAGPRPIPPGPGNSRGTKDDAEGVLSVLRPGPDPTSDRPGIRVYAPPVYRHHYDGARWSKCYGDTPTAAYACTCGDTRTATGATEVAALVAAYDAHKNACAGLPALPERRDAA